MNSKRRKPTTSKSTNPKASAARSKLSLKARRTKVQDLNKDEDVETARKNTEKNEVAPRVFTTLMNALMAMLRMSTMTTEWLPSQNTVNNKKCVPQNQKKLRPKRRNLQKLKPNQPVQQAEGG